MSSLRLIAEGPAEIVRERMRIHPRAEQSVWSSVRGRLITALREWNRSHEEYGPDGPHDLEFIAGDGRRGLRYGIGVRFDAIPTNFGEVKKRGIRIGTLSQSEFAILYPSGIARPILKWDTESSGIERAYLGSLTREMLDAASPQASLDGLRWIDQSQQLVRPLLVGESPRLPPADGWLPVDGAEWVRLSKSMKESAFELLREFASGTGRGQVMPGDVLDVKGLGKGRITSVGKGYAWYHLGTAPDDPTQFQGSWVSGAVWIKDLTWINSAWRTTPDKLGAAGDGPGAERFAASGLPFGGDNGSGMSGGVV